MSRRRYRRYYRRGKYNIETRKISLTTSTSLENGFYQNSTIVVPPSTTEGVRQVTRFTINLVNVQDDSLPIYWALVYIPEGAVTTALFPDESTLFNPSNYVLASGVTDSNAGPIRIYSRIRKNLNANDRIYLLTAASQQSRNYAGLIKYAIKYN